MHIIGFVAFLTSLVIIVRQFFSKQALLFFVFLMPKNCLTRWAVDITTNLREVTKIDYPTEQILIRFEILSN